MSKKKAWWKKISIKSVTGFLGKTLNVLAGAQAGAEAPPAQPSTINVNVPKQDNTQLLLIGGAALLVVVVIAMSSRGR